MGGPFNIDSPFMSFLSKIADLIILNLLVVICSIPVVTVGASWTAMYYVLMRIRNDETTSVTKDFFYAFKLNFKQATILWAFFLVVIAVLVIEYVYLFVVGLETIANIKIFVYVITALVLISLAWSFALLSRYNNSIGRIILNSYLIGLTEFPCTLCMVVLMLLPVALALIFPGTVPVILLIGFSLTGYLETLPFKRVFAKLESAQAENT